MTHIIPFLSFSIENSIHKTLQQREIKTVAKNIFPLSYCLLVPFSIPCHLDTIIEFFSFQITPLWFKLKQERTSFHCSFSQQCDDASHENYFAICREGWWGVEKCYLLRIENKTADQCLLFRSKYFNVDTCLFVSVRWDRWKGVHYTPKD